MTTLIILLCVALIVVIIVQIGKVTELAGKIRGEEEMQDAANRRQSFYLLVFMPLFLIGCIWSAYYYKNYMLGYGPHDAASAHGGSLDYLFNITLFFSQEIEHMKSLKVAILKLFYFLFKNDRLCSSI